MQGLKRGLTNYGDAEFSMFLRKAFVKAMGYSDDALLRPIVGITNTYSDYNACHGNVPNLIEAVKRGVMLAGGLPMEFPTVSIHESFAHPTSMFLRNLMAMDTEEMIRAQPMDSVVLIGGCDKTIPAQLMAAASADVPAIVLPVGPMLVGHYQGEVLGACTDCRRLWSDFRGDRIGAAEIEVINERLAPTAGTCMVMGTASTIACAVEALGMSLPLSATIPATHADRIRCAEASGRAAVTLAAKGTRPSEVMTAARVSQCTDRHAEHRRLDQRADPSDGGRRPAWHPHRSRRIRRARPQGAGVDRLETIGPALHGALPLGGRRSAPVTRARGLLDMDARTVGGTLADTMNAATETHAQTVIRPRAEPLNESGSMAVLRGNLAPRGALIKQSAASPKLMQHTGRAVVFDSLEDLAARIDDDALDVKADDVLVLRNAGPKGAPGMPEAGYLPIPKKLARAGVKDMVRISDARMSGTAFGTIVLHITPESAVGGPLALVRNGDRIQLDVEKRRIELLVDEAELAKRQSQASTASGPEFTRGYAALFMRSVLQADQGCDFDFLVPPA